MTTTSITIPPSPNASGGSTYTTDGSSLPKRDLTGYGYTTWLLQMFQDIMTFVNAGVTAITNAFAATAATSATSQSLASTGTLTFTLDQSTPAFTTGTLVKVYRASDSTKWMNGSTGVQSGTSLPITMTQKSGVAGPFTDWVIVPISASLPVATQPGYTRVSAYPATLSSNVPVMFASAAGGVVNLPAGAADGTTIPWRYDENGVPSAANRLVLTITDSNTFSNVGGTTLTLDIQSGVVVYDATATKWGTR